jgi:hypothetical protein
MTCRKAIEAHQRSIDACLEMLRILDVRVKALEADYSRQVTLNDGSQ